MTPFIEAIRRQYKKDAYFKDRLEVLYAAMDSTYEEASASYGFVCTGCKDNCCFTRFYHHTFIEYFYILDGFDMMEHDKKIEIRQSADEVCNKLEDADRKGLIGRELCPLNDNSLCVLYPYRPMICRLHGVPHELNTPGKETQRNPGCEYFLKHHGYKDYFSFDRTTIYMEMANLEKEFRQKTGITDKIKLTVAEMIRSHHF